MLAIKGGEKSVAPEFQRFIHPRISPEMVTAVIDQLNEAISIYDNGGIYHKLEKSFEKWLCVENALSVTSGTIALFSMYYSLNLKPGDEVIVPTYTFFATATPLLPLGLVPVFADCDESGNLDHEDVASRITPRTKAVVMTHMWGIPCDISDLKQLSAKHGLVLLEDASHAHGARYNNSCVGSTTDGAAWSLQGKKNLSAGEGGIFATKHRGMFERAILLGHFNVRAKLDVSQATLKPFAPTGTGFNFRMHPLGAAIALQQLKLQDRMLIEKREVADFLKREIDAIPGLSTLDIGPAKEPSWYAFPIRYDAKELGGLTKKRFVEAVVAEGAEEVDIPSSTRPIHEYPIFRDYAKGSFPGADRFHAELIKLPVWYGKQRNDYALAYVNALRRVAINYKDLI